MNVYIEFLYFTVSFVIIYLPITETVPNKYLDVVKNFQGEVHPCAMGIHFYTILNNTSDEDFYIELLPDECCLENSGSLDCESLQIVGDSADVLPKGMTEKFQLIAPLINPVERRGYCSYYIDSRPVDRKNRIMRDTVKVNFDTSIESNPQLNSIKPCDNLDEDPLNSCKPVNCELYYNGQKPFYDKRKKKCVKSQFCTEDQIYNTRSNDCKNYESITDTDLGFIQSLVKHGTRTKDIFVIKTVHAPKRKNITATVEGQNKQVKQIEQKFTIAAEANTTSGEENSTEFEETEPEVVEDGQLVENTVQGLPTPTHPKPLKTLLKKLDSREDDGRFIDKFFCYLKNNKCTLLILALVLLLQCSLLAAMIYYVQAAKCCQKKKVVRKFFNYRQDASVTTPLIGTSNMDTDTTEFNYLTESSNVDKKIKCYKACHKELTNQAKVSMSDDILTKYLNRRDWNVKLKSENEQEQKCVRTDPTTYEIKRVVDATEENEHLKKCDLKHIMKHPEKDSDDTGLYKSEREIRSHDYHATTKTGFLENNQKPMSKKTASVSSEKGAQACFSNDSVDDLLSEKGVLFFEENISKYSFSTSSPLVGSSGTDRSSKTSKNNLIKHFLSFLTRKSKLAVSSEPGNTARDKLELIHVHMDKGSVNSSSDSNVKKITSNKFFKESRSTF